ncbi:MAG: helix-turn-helix domain-containing protein [Myxococcota bacterium]
MALGEVWVWFDLLRSTFLRSANASLHLRVGTGELEVAAGEVLQVPRGEMIVLRASSEGPRPIFELRPAREQSLGRVELRGADGTSLEVPCAVVSGQVRRLRRRLDGCVGRRIRVAEIMAGLKGSKFHLTRQFHREVGLPPASYLRALRCARARSLLRTGRPSREVWRMCGFYDSSHLARDLRELLGLRNMREFAPRAQGVEGSS